MKIAVVNDNEDLGGLTTDLVGRPVAYMPLGTYQRPSKFVKGKTDTIMRTRAFGLTDDGQPDPLGIRLIFWEGVQRTITEKTIEADVALGILHQQEQVRDSSRTVYVLNPVDTETEAAFQAAYGDEPVPSEGPDLTPDEAPF